MATSIRAEAQASVRNNPNELYLHTSEVSRPSNIGSSIQTADARTPVTEYHYPHHSQQRHNMSSQCIWMAQGRGMFPFSVPHHQAYGQPWLALPGAAIPAQLPITLGTAKQSIAPGSQYVSTPEGPKPINVPVQGISKNYQGNHFAQRNQSANIAPDQSTSVWITNLPPDCNYRDLLGVVRDTGKVYATVINPPQNNFTTSAAKIVFFDVQGRRRFEARANAGHFAVGPYVPRVRPNRILTAAQPAGRMSRILHITGPANIVNKDVLCQYFQKRCSFDLEYTRRSLLEDGNATMEWAFGSYRCQAERVFNAIRDSHTQVEGRNIWNSVNVWYGRDPCDRNVPNHVAGNAS
ncbi:hypothetical protein F4801DRAFT_581443 [Xylaria longipes]|nr:hypothetical protein F4801DRAFT_581443 [Xylaria longipes]